MSKSGECYAGSEGSLVVPETQLDNQVHLEGCSPIANGTHPRAGEHALLDCLRRERIGEGEYPMIPMKIPSNLCHNQRMGGVHLNKG